MEKTAEIREEMRLNIPNRGRNAELTDCTKDDIDIFRKYLDEDSKTDVNYFHLHIDLPEVKYRKIISFILNFLSI
jgi:hypothetical protein